MSQIKTRILIISDTHATSPHPPPAPHEFDTADLVTVITGYRTPLPRADVVLHCGDLTKRSSIPEYEATFSMLRSLDAPLKLVIAGNHDLLLDAAFSSDEEASQAVERIVRDARADGVRYLSEGTHEFTLENGARLKVYASPYTPTYGSWAFQYPASHEFAIPPGVDVAMTHGPPYGVLDEAGILRHRGLSVHAGCRSLFKAVAFARPRVHCFGHIHEAWGAYRGAWLDRDAPGFEMSWPTKERVMNVDMSGPIQTMDELRPMFAADTEGTSPETRQKLAQLSEQRGYHIDWTEEKTRVGQGAETLFLNASIMDFGFRPSQLPWILDLHLPSESER
ncbi:ser/Thr protein phosphatase family protein [Metarhizium rileyi]|uniref:Ser/Thr protein phosphatase family protein n=1 Tax=Metarhizium rileyi (strain RCEF 4871) TaxID=1649241 RepID=A0A167GRP1_METRR|nr:ser/Thr protein phosphatase family protein [Metarhizium rileyi RCEF 4871]